MKRLLSLALAILLVTALIVSTAPLTLSAETIASGTCLANLTWVLTDDGRMTISGIGLMQDFTSTSYPWNDYKDQIKSVVIEQGVFGIGSYAFEDCTELTSITIPDSVDRIGKNAFKNTAYYNDESNWENDMLYWNNWLFDAKDDISGECSIKQGTTLIACGVFEGYTELTGITIPDSVSKISETVFKDCTELTSITIPGTVKTIE